MKIKKQTTYKMAIGEINELPSETIPDQSLSPQQLLEQYSRGMPVKEAFYDEENDWNLQGLDLTEIDMLRERYIERQKTAKEALGQLERERLKILKEQEEDARAKRLEELRELTQKQSTKDS